MHSSRPIGKNFLEDFVSDSTQNALNLKADDNSVIHNTGNEVKDGNLILNDDLILPNIVDDITADVANVAISTITNRLVTIPTELSSSGNIKVAVTNKTGVTILKGSAVYIDGAQGSKATIALALADTDVTTSLALGIVENDIANNASGYVVAIGEITKLDTSAFTNGDKIYVSPTVAGGLTSVIPTSPNNVMFVGTVTNSHATQGKILINVLYTFKLDRLVDVSLNTLTNNDLLSYETSSGLWKNKSFSTLGLTTGTGTTNYLSKWSSLTGLTNSQIFDNGSNVLINTTTDSGVGKLQVNGDINIPNLDGGFIKQFTYTISSWARNLVVLKNTAMTNTNGFNIGVLGSTIDYDYACLGFGDYLSPLNMFIRGNGSVGIGTNIDNGVDKLQINGSLTSTANKVTGGLSTQFQKGDGSLDSTTYAPTSRTLNINGDSFDLSTNREWRVAQGDTGALTYGGITIASGTTVNIGACTGYVVNNESDPSNPTFTYVNYAGETNKTVTTIGSGLATYVLLNSSGVIVFQNTFPTSTQRKTHIWLSKVSHPNSTSLAYAINEVDFITSPLAQFRDFFQSINYVNEGLVASPNGANLNINTSSGTIIGDGLNFVADKTSPNFLPVVSQTPASFVYRNQNGGTSGLVSLIDPTQYDNGGTTTLIGGGTNRSTNQYIFYAPGAGFVIQRGQVIYNTLSEAIAGVGKEPFVTYSNLVKNSILIGAISLRHSTTNLSDTAFARFFTSDKFGQLIGSIAGISLSTLQTAYNNSVDPEIVTNSVLGGVSIRRGSAADGDNVFEIQNGAGSVTAVIDGNGNILANTFLTPTGTASQFLMADGTVSTLITARGYKAHTVVLDQLGVADPTPTVIGTNDIGAIVWTRNSVGTYFGTLTGAFTANKTFHVLMNPQGTSNTTRIKGIRNSADVYQISTHVVSTDTLTDGLLVGTAIEIRVYN